MMVLLWFLIRQLYDASAAIFAKTQGRGTIITPKKERQHFQAPLDLGLTGALAPV